MFVFPPYVIFAVHMIVKALHIYVCLCFQIKPSMDLPRRESYFSSDKTFQVLTTLACNNIEMLHCAECNMTFLGSEELLLHEPIASAITFPNCQKKLCKI